VSITIVKFTALHMKAFKSVSSSWAYVMHLNRIVVIVLGPNVITDLTTNITKITTRAAACQ